VGVIVCASIVILFLALKRFGGHL